MGDVILTATTSLDGFLAGEDDGVGPLFDWYSSGDVEVTLGDPDRVFRTSAASAAHLDRARQSVGCSVVGRHLFDLTDGWGGVPASGDAVVVVTHRVPDAWVERHPGAPYHFVTTGVADAVALGRQLAGDRDVAVTAGDVGGQALAAGLVDVVRLDLAPVVMGRGKRFFGDLGDLAGADGLPLLLDDPEVVQGSRVTHLVYRVQGR